MQTRGVVIAGTHSGAGKTTVTLGLLSALVSKGYKVQAFKVGPDFIDPGIHRLITGRPSRNLDLYMCNRDRVKNIFETHSFGADISVVEGVMGLYDGVSSTYEIARVLELPVILVVDTHGMAESIGAVVSGFKNFRIDCNIVGVILNRVGSERHFERLKSAIHDLPVLGYLPRNREISIPERHLGLKIAEETPLTESSIKILSTVFSDNVDIDRLLDISRIKISSPKQMKNTRTSNKNVRVGVARDRAFSFYYEDNLDELRNNGAELVFFSPLNDRKLPANIQGLYIGGGYPELYIETLSKNRDMLHSIRKFIECGGVTYAECGGFIYLCEGLNAEDGSFYPLVGIFPFRIRLENRLQALGYRCIRLKENTIIGNMGDEVRGHEFHYTKIVDSSGYISNVYEGGSSGYTMYNCLASYVHLYFFSNPVIASSLISKMKETSIVQ